MYGLECASTDGDEEKPNLEVYWRGALSDYVTCIAWSPDGTILAASSAAGEVVLWRGMEDLLTLLPPAATSIDCLAFSHDGQFLAAGGQDGRVQIWRSPNFELVATLKNAPAWVDKLAWNPLLNQLAFSLGRYVQVWDGDTGNIAATLNFEASSVFDIVWHPDGKILTVAGYQGVKAWNSGDWNAKPYLLEVPTASLAIAWSHDGKYLASGNFDRTLTVLEWNNPLPWVMRGFPGKIRSLDWSQPVSSVGAPLLALSSAEGVVVWEKHESESVGWQGRVLESHEGVVSAIAFQPNATLLASAALDGWLCLWDNAQELGQAVDGAPKGFSCLAWHPQGYQLAAGGINGELLIW
ncbi:WD40 repeat domain-containing protein [Microcoleus sp. FACHB-831]|uniref:WD40 repeat domain-containing protein n=1 Tax=Microcoleus sp. FACHB-831 TaxID=2692827 RepID=UPI001682E0DB|nr:WD40 repeat domain-containing protein [Microcoleus sp. FACHB-831]MBD1923592.1 WD40 repeat domain-containing protein [Microcoleus sp. FACHB-831]